jgi:hypothetical protein
MGLRLRLDGSGRGGGGMDGIACPAMVRLKDET